MKNKLIILLFTFAAITILHENSYCQTANPPKLKALNSTINNHPGGYLWGGYSVANYWHVGGMLAGQTIGIESNFFGSAPRGFYSDNAASIGFDYRLIPSENFFAYAAINYTTKDGGMVFPTLGVNLHLFDTTGFDMIIKIGKGLSSNASGNDLGVQLSYAF